MFLQFFTKFRKKTENFLSGRFCRLILFTRLQNPKNMRYFRGKGWFRFMSIITDSFVVSTKGFTDIIDITEKVSEIVKKHNITEASAQIYSIGSTASVTTLEYEPGLLKDLPEALEKIAPVNKEYHHDMTWQDGNGYAHIRSALTGTFATVPVINGELFLGTWQQLVLMDFDNKPRTRTITVQFLF